METSTQTHEHQYQIQIGREHFTWPSEFITAREVLGLVHEDPNEFYVVIKAKGEEDPLPLDQPVDLKIAENRHFRTIPKHTTEGSGFLPDDDRQHLNARGLNFEEAQENAKRGVTIKNFPLPPGKFQIDAADVLVLIPQGYPDAQLDMFYVNPPLMLKPSGQEARNANVRENHFGRTWQRWSRHYKPGQWRTGVDDLQSHLQVVENALRDAG